MTRTPDSSIFLQNTTGDSGFENLYVYGKFNYDFSREDLNVKRNGSCNSRYKFIFKW